MSTPLDERLSLVIHQMFNNGGGASVADLRAWGVERTTVNQLLRRGEIHRTSRGRYSIAVAAVGDVWQQRRSAHLRAAAAVGGGDRVLAMRTAALVWGLPIASLPERVELIRPPGSRTPEATRAVRRRLPDGSVTTVNGVPVTTLSQTAVDLALDLPTPDALVTVDAVLRRGVEREVLSGLLASLGRTPGCSEARRTLGWADGHSESALESRGRGELMLRGAPRPWCNVSFRLEGEEFRADQWWGEFTLAGEADGALKYSSDQATTRALWAEKLRQEWFEDELGISVFRYVDAEVRLAPDRLARRFVRKRRRRGSTVWTPPRSLEVFQRPLPGSTGRRIWLRRPYDG